MYLISTVTWAVFLVILVVRAGSVLVAHREGRQIVRKRVEAEQSRKDREHLVIFEQKRVKIGADLTDMAKTLSAHSFGTEKHRKLPFLPLPTNIYKKSG